VASSVGCATAPRTGPASSSGLASSHNHLIYRLIDPNVRCRLRRHARGRLLDIGCGDQPYRAMAAPWIDEYVGLDHIGTRHDLCRADLVGTAYEIPVPDQSFDTVLCTDVLEHLEEPAAAVAEACRVLKPGGFAIYTVPLFWHLHEEPRDFYRYTKYGLDHLFRKAGFEIVEITALSGFCATFAQELVYFLYGFRRGGPVNPLWWLVPVIGAVIQTLGLLLNKIDRSTAFTVEYIAVARKPEADG
jgi:SAM-dependent methyltransferase